MYQSSMHNLRHYCGTVVTCRYVLPPSLASFDMHNQVVRTFDHAVAQTVIQFPLLQVGLVGESSRKPAWVALPTIDLVHHIEWQVISDADDYDAKFQAGLQYQLDTEFDHLETRPGWRLFMMRNGAGSFIEVMFAWNHANCDGMSGKIFHQALLESLNCPDRSIAFLPGSTSISTDVSAERFPPAQEKLAKFPITMGFALSETWHTFGPSSLSSKTAAKATWAPVHLYPFETRTSSISINKDTLKRILGACRKHGTTLTGLLHGIVLVCLATYLPKETATAFSSGTAMDQRRFMGENERDPNYAWLNPHKSIQNCVSSIYHTFDSHTVDNIRAQARINTWAPQPIRALEDSIWSAANAVREDITKRLDLGLTNSVIGLMKLVRDWREYHQEMEKKPRALSWIITNVGVIDGQPKTGGDSWSIDEAKFTLSSDVAGPFLQISSVSVKGGSLSIHVSWQDHEDGNHIGWQLAKDLEAWLRELGA
ncbi:hypothetical protein ACJ41O_014382 [Fusarium nematophilum]